MKTTPGFCVNTLRASLAPFKSHGERKRAARAPKWLDAREVLAQVRRSASR